MTSNSPTYGSVEWFAAARIQVFDQTLTLFHIHSATEIAQRMIDVFETADEVMAAALFRSMVIEYGKPFTSSRGINTYSFNSIKKSNGVDAEAHRELLSVRNKLVAHQDDDYTDKILLTVCATAAMDGLSVSFPAALQFSGLFLNCIKEKQLLLKYFDHLKACQLAVVDKAYKSMEAYREAVAHNYTNFIKFTENPRFRAQGVPVETSDGKADVPPLRYAIDLNLPKIANKNGFLYRVFTFAYNKEGSITATDQAGNVHSITINGMDIISTEIDNSKA